MCIHIKNPAISRIHRAKLLYCTIRIIYWIRKGSNEWDTYICRKRFNGEPYCTMCIYIGYIYLLQKRFKWELYLNLRTWEFISSLLIMKIYDKCITNLDEMKAIRKFKDWQPNNGDWWSSSQQCTFENDQEGLFCKFSLELTQGLCPNLVHPSCWGQATYLHTQSMKYKFEPTNAMQKNIQWSSYLEMAGMRRRKSEREAPPLQVKTEMAAEKWWWRGRKTVMASSRMVTL